MDAKTLALGALTDGLSVASDPRPSRRVRHRLLAKASKGDFAVVAVVSFSSRGLILTYSEFSRAQDHWHFVGGSARDLDWEELSPLPPGQGPTRLASSSGGVFDGVYFTAWSHLHVPANLENASTRRGSGSTNGHFITFD